MSTIEELCTEHVEHDSTALVKALVEREQEAVDRLLLYADRLNLMPFIVSKVIGEVGLGEPLSEEAKKHIDEQYQNYLKEIEGHAEQRLQMLRAMGAPIPEDVHAHVKDPLADDIDVVVPDSPEETS